MKRLFTPFVALCTAGILARFSYSLARSPVLPLFALYLGAGPESIGFIVGISTVTGIFFKLPAGALSDIIGRKKTMLLGLMVFATIPFAYLLIKGKAALMAIRFIHGFATAIYGPVSMSVVADYAGAKKGQMLSWFSSITMKGTMLGAPVGGFILHGISGSKDVTIGQFHMAYIVSGLAGILSFVLALLLFRHGKDEDKQNVTLKESVSKLKSGIKEVVSDKRILITSNMEGLQNMTLGALEAFLPIYAVTIAGLNEFQAGLLWGIQVVITSFSKPIMGIISDKFGRKMIIASGMVLCAVSFGIIPFLTGFYNLLITALLFGLGEAFVTSSSAALIADVCKEKHFGTAMGVFGSIFDIGHASGPILAGFLVANYGYQHSFWLMSLLLLISVPIFIWQVKVDKNVAQT